MIKAVSKREIPESSFGKAGERHSVYRDDVKEFLEGGYSVCECFRSGKKGPRPSIVAQNYRYMIKKMNVPVKVLLRGDRVFMMKEAENA